MDNMMDAQTCRVRRWSSVMPLPIMLLSVSGCMTYELFVITSIWCGIKNTFGTLCVLQSTCFQSCFHKHLDFGLCTTVNYVCYYCKWHFILFIQQLITERFSVWNVEGRQNLWIWMLHAGLQAEAHGRPAAKCSIRSWNKTADQQSDCSVGRESGAPTLWTVQIAMLHGKLAERRTAKPKGNPKLFWYVV